MYVPRPFAVGPEDSRALLSKVSAGHLVTCTEVGMLATLMPWVLDASGDALVGHVARPNPQWHTPWQGQALVIADGPHGYVSPTWYASKREHGRVVPTWNYVLLHIYGDLIIHDDPAWVGAAVRGLTDVHEQSRVEPWSVDDAPEDYLRGQLRGIVGTELRIQRVEASMKMSQNKSASDVAGVAAGFAADGNFAVADLVRRPAP